MITICRSGVTGSRQGLKIPWAIARAGSSPVSDTNMTPWCNGNTRDFDSLVVGSTPTGVGRVICRASPWCAMDNAKFYKIGRFLYFYLPKSTYI